MVAEPIVDHRMSQRFRFFAASGHNFWNAFDITGMNDDSPVVPFNPGAEGVPYAPVLHHPIQVLVRIIACANRLLDKLCLPLQNFLEFARLSPTVRGANWCLCE